MPDNKVTQEDKARIMSSQAGNDKDTGPGSFYARAQGAADKNDPPEPKKHGHGHEHGKDGDAPAGKK